MRIFAAQDIDPLVLADIRVDAMRPSLEAAGRFDPEKAKERFLVDYVPDDTRLIFEGEMLVGFFVLRQRVDHLYLDHLYVRPEHQKGGLGRHVMQMVQDEARASRLPLRLIALKGSPANAFYLSCGFELRSSDALDNEYVWSA